MRVPTLVALLVIVLTPAAFAETEYSPAELDAAHAQLTPRLAGCDTPSTCTMIYAKIALIERPGGALGQLAMEGLLGSLGHSKKGLTIVFNEGDAEARKRVLDLYRERWNTLGRGFDPNLSEKCVFALESEDAIVRRAAARLIANYPVPGSAHAAIDASSGDPSLTQAAVMSIGVSQSFYGARWVVEQLTHEDEAVRKSAKYTLFALGRRVVGPIKDAVQSDDPAKSEAALDALLMMAFPEDVSLLYEWLNTRGKDSSPELKDRVLRVLAEVESGLYQPERPQPVPLELP